MGELQRDRESCVLFITKQDVLLSSLKSKQLSTIQSVTHVRKVFHRFKMYGNVTIPQLKDEILNGERTNASQRLTISVEVRPENA